MGTEFNFVCKDCKVDYNLGYGSYGWYNPFIDKTLKELEDCDEGVKDYAIFNNYKQCLILHSLHDWDTYNTDYCFEDKGNIHMIGSYGTLGDMVVKNHSEYRRVESDKIQGWSSCQLWYPFQRYLKH